MFRVRFTPGLFKQNYRSPKKRINSLFKFFSEAITEANKNKHPPFFGICFKQTRHLGSENLKGNSKLRGKWRYSITWYLEFFRPWWHYWSWARRARIEPPPPPLSPPLRTIISSFILSWWVHSFTYLLLIHHW